jgi:hypothetical protein
VEKEREHRFAQIQDQVHLMQQIMDTMPALKKD